MLLISRNFSRDFVINNDWTTYQDFSPTYPLEHIFDGTTTSYARGSVIDSTTSVKLDAITLTSPSSYVKGIVAEKFEVYCPGATTGYIVTGTAVSGTGTALQNGVTADTWSDVDFNGELKSITLIGNNSQAPRLGAIRINGTTILQDDMIFVESHHDLTGDIVDGNGNPIDRAVDVFDTSKYILATTNNNVDPVFSSVTRAVGVPPEGTTYIFNKLGSAVRFPLQGRRPAYGLKYPRGNYNK
tara:strand:- start:5426 stop:6151 length:726 start_codon:yes stop_codon:yes gene_type:complete